MNQWMPSPDEISPEELHERLKQHPTSVVLMDVREPFEHEHCRLEGAVLMPLRELPARVGKLNPDDEIVVYCHHGMRSMQAAEYLQHAGFKQVRSLQGGIDLWSLTVDPSVPRY